MTSAEKETLFIKVLENHKNQIYRVCWGFSTNPADVEDLFQEVMLNLWKGIEGYKGIAQLSTWIYRITVNTCILWKKRQSKNQKLTAHYEKEFPEVGEIAEVTQNEQIVALKKAIQQLKKMDRTLILLILEECSYKEIAEITGMTVSNVGARISRIKVKIKDLLRV